MAFKLEKNCTVEKKGEALYSIKSDLEFWPWSSHKVRAVETAIARLRVDHAGLAQYLFRFGQAPAPLCDCGEIETVDHYLIDCDIFIQQRRELKANLVDNNILLLFSKKLLLGGEKLKVPEQMKVQNGLVKFLKDTGKLYDI